MWLAATCFAWICSTEVWSAQPATGTVQGHVYNPGRSEYIRNAEVKLEGTAQVVFTENDGYFQFSNVAPGSTTISVSYAGYATAREPISIVAGETATKEINLTSSALSEPRKESTVVKLEAFSVSTTRDGNSKAIMAQRKNMNIITSVSSDVFGDVIDGNVGEFLKYLPGVDLDYVESEARGPRLGGMDGQYVGVSFDGVRNASADANRGGGSASRATSFEGFSITSVESVEINRTASPENDADSPAGNVNMKLKRAFDRKGRVFTYSYSANLNGEEWSLKQLPGPRDSANNYKEYRWAPNWQASYAESFNDKKFGILLGASHARSYTEQASSTTDYNRTPTATDPRQLVVRSIDFGDSPKTIIKDALMLTADWRATPHLTLSTNLNYSYFEGNSQGRFFTFTAANSNTNAVNGRSTVLGDGVLTVIAPRDLSQAVGALDGNGLSRNNGAANLSNGGGSGSKTTIARQYVEKAEYKMGSWVFEGYVARSYAKNNYEALERGFSRDETGNVPSGWTATRPNQQSWEWTIRQNSGGDWFDLRNWTSNTGVAPTQTTSGATTGGTRVTNDNRTWITGKWTGQLDATWAVPFLEKFPTKMKMGLKWDQEIRNNHTDTELDTFAYIGPGGNTVALSPTTGQYITTSFGNWANVGPQYISKFPFDMGTTNAMAGGGVYNLNGTFGMPPRVARSEIANLFNAHPEQFVNMSTPENYYTDHYVNAIYYKQTVEAGYWQADSRLTSKLQVRFGVRAEKTINAPLEFDPLTRNELLALGVPLNPAATNGGRPLTIAGMKTMFETHPKVERRTQYTNYFPSLVVKYQVMPNLEWQAGVNKAIARPAIADITGLWTTNDGASPPTVTASNPALLPEYHKVYQTRVAYYFGGRSPGQVSLAYIQDEAKNFVVAKTFTAEEFGVKDPDYTGYTFISKTNDVSLQRYKNFDFNYNQTLGFLPSEYLRGISVGATYSRSYANARRNLIAPHRVSARLGYTYRKFNGSVGGIWIDDRPVDGIYGRVWGAMTKLDISASYRLSRYASVFVQARNPTNQKDLYYESPPNVAEGKNKYLRKQEEYGDNWVLGVKGEF